MTSCRYAGSGAVSRSPIAPPALIAAPACRSGCRCGTMFQTTSQKRIMRRNKDLVRRACAPWATEEQYDLFRTYLGDRHSDGGMADMDVCEFASMIEETTVKSRIIEYHDPSLGDNSLIASCLTDIMGDGMSMVYSFFDPGQSRRSLGLFMILDHIAIAREAGLPHIYLGYWVPGLAQDGLQGQVRPV